MDEKQFEQEYKKWKHQEAPQLWEQIEGGLKEHPERERKGVFLSFHWAFICAATAAVLSLTMIVPRLYQDRVSVNREGTADSETARFPEEFVTIPEDSRYFSEEVLSDTELLLKGNVKDIFFECDRFGRADKIVYQMNLEQVYYAQDYISGEGDILVKSPIIEAQGNEIQSLYQLQRNCSYLLPLCQRDGDWELVYPFAPQVQMMKNGTYLFHTGYISLVNEETKTAAQSQEGLNDYFYDRMRIREDEEFLSEFIQLVKREVREKQ